MTQCEAVGAPAVMCPSTRHVKPLVSTDWYRMMWSVMCWIPVETHRCLWSLLGLGQHGSSVDDVTQVSERTLYDCHY